MPLPVTPLIEVPVTPAGASAKSVASTPVTDSLKVTVKCTLAAAVGSASARLMETTVGAVLSIVKTAPVNGAVKALPAASSTAASATALSPSVPSPLPVLAVTV